MEERADGMVTGVLIGMIAFAVMASPFNYILVPAIIVCGLVYGAFVNFANYIKEKDSK